jgi:hypothetical protein
LIICSIDGAAREGSVGPARGPTPHIAVEFDQPQAMSGLFYEVEETTRQRTQEVRVEASDDGGRAYRQILVREYNFSPREATFQREEQRFDLRLVTHLRLTIVPNKSGSGAASLTTLRLFAQPFAEKAAEPMAMAMARAFAPSINQPCEAVFDRKNRAEFLPYSDKFDDRSQMRAR